MNDFEERVSAAFKNLDASEISTYYHKLSSDEVPPTGAAVNVESELNRYANKIASLNDDLAYSLTKITSNLHIMEIGKLKIINVYGVTYADFINYMADYTPTIAISCPMTLLKNGNENWQGYVFYSNYNLKWGAWIVGDDRLGTTPADDVKLYGQIILI